MQEINGDKFTPHSVIVSRWPNHASEYVARIVGQDSVFGLKREFCKVIDRDWSRSGKHGNTVIGVNVDGIYEVQSPKCGQYGRQARYYVMRRKGLFRQIRESVVHEFVRRVKASILEERTNQQKKAIADLDATDEIMASFSEGLCAKGGHRPPR